MRFGDLGDPPKIDLKESTMQGVSTWFRNADTTDLWNDPWRRLSKCSFNEKLLGQKE